MWRWRKEKVKPSHRHRTCDGGRVSSTGCGVLSRATGRPLCILWPWSAIVAWGTAASTATRKSRETRRAHGEKPARHQVLHLFNVCTPRPYARRSSQSRVVRPCPSSSSSFAVVPAIFRYRCTFHASIKLFNLVRFPVRSFSFLSVFPPTTVSFVHSRSIDGVWRFYFLPNLLDIDVSITILCIAHDHRILLYCNTSALTIIQLSFVR